LLNVLTSLAIPLTSIPYQLNQCKSLTNAKPHHHTHPPPSQADARAEQDLKALASTHPKPLPISPPHPKDCTKATKKSDLPSKSKRKPPKARKKNL